MTKTATRKSVKKTPRKRPRRGWLVATAAGTWRWWRRLRWRTRLALLGLAAVLVPLAAGTVVYATAEIPDPDALVGARSSILYDVNGQEMGRLHGGEDRVAIPFADMPLHLRRAVLAAEDKDFYAHRGLSPFGIVRAAMRNVLSRSIKEGGSTITQQYVKNAFVGSSRSPWRKVREAAIAIKLERTRSKDEIFAAYLNTIYFGRGAFGIEAASRAYFGHVAKKLTLAESALLAGMIRAPETLDPARRPSQAKAARDRILDRMVSLRWAEPAAAEAAKRVRLDDPKNVKPRAAVTSGVGAYFIEDIRRRLVRDYGASTVYRGGLRIYTTLDRQMQIQAEAAVRSVLDRPTDPEASLVAIDPATGGVRAMVGGRDFERSEFNLASQARRQPGSTFKPFVLAAAVADGMPPTQAFRAPAKMTLQTGFQPWTVSNYDRRDYGTLSVVDATKFSVNTVYAQMILEIGPSRAREMAMAAGITSNVSAVPSLALGTSETTVLEMASAYGTFAARGSYAKPYLIRRIVDARGLEVYSAPPQRSSAVSTDVADTVNFVLQKVVKEGTGRRADLGRPVAGKTGTTESNRDAWFAGYTPNLSTVVWMGFPDERRTMQNVRGIGVTGGSFPARIWRAFMERAVERLPAASFAPPPPFPTPSPTTTTPTATASPAVTVIPTAPQPSPTASGSGSSSPSPSPKPSGSPPPPSPSPSPSGSASAQASAPSRGRGGP